MPAYTWTIPDELLPQMTPDITSRITEAIADMHRTRAIHGLPRPSGMYTITVRGMLAEDYPDPDKVTEMENYALTIAGATRVVAVVRCGFRVVAVVTLAVVSDIVYRSTHDTDHHPSLPPVVLETAKKRAVETLDALGLGEFVGTTDVTMLDLRRGRDGFGTTLSVAVKDKVVCHILLTWRYNADLDDGIYDVQTHVPQDTLVVDRGEPDPNPTIHEY
ncbi:hypothetical protein [Alcaligenes faecalis]|uniref:hypothetical protein n=1 Tax=Alcaligenes faecalis TaxID=511 RepID=UPI00126A0015|nr:hypothetical protein [Alcaligenes faecalis]